VDEKGVEFPISRTYSHPCMLVTGNVQPDEYEKLAELVEKLTKMISVKNILSESQKIKTAIIF
jgi:hypothetical protein